MKRILIIKLWALGDLLMATPLLTALKRQWPDSRIIWLADQEYAGILQDNPLLDQVIPFDSGTWRKHFRYGKLLAYWAMSRKLQKDLKNLHLDIVINLTAEKWWSVWFNIAPVRIGLFPRPVPGRMGKLYTTAIARNDSPIVHNSVHYLRPAAALGISGPYDQHLVLGVSDEAAQAVERFLLEQPGYDPKQPLLVLHPGASQASKCWPPQLFAQVAEKMAAQYNIVITGSAKERPLAEAVLSALSLSGKKPIIAAGRLPDLRQTIALIARAAAVVTGDTSVLHIASALDTPLVGIYGSTRPGDNSPLFGRQALLFDDSVPCAPCYKADCPLHGEDFLRCQCAVTPGRVISALNTLLKESHEPCLTC
jgi:heptosyltransferase-1